MHDDVLQPVSVTPRPDLLARVRAVQLAAGLGHQIPGHPDYYRGPIPSDLARPTLCVYLGPVVKRESCLCPMRNTYVCGKGWPDCRPDTECQTCGEYEADA